jgi:drug/metabolite transporter (DMT)-like permease
VNDIPPMAMTFFRWFFAILIRGPFVRTQLRRNWPVLASACHKESSSRSRSFASTLATYSLLPPWRCGRFTRSGSPGVQKGSACFLALVSLALFSSVLSYVFWNRGVEALGANVAGVFVHLVPVFGVIVAWLLLGERLEAFHVAGIALILAGI